MKKTGTVSFVDVEKGTIDVKFPNGKTKTYNAKDVDIYGSADDDIVELGDKVIIKENKMKKSKLNTLITELYKEGAQQELRMEIRRLVKEHIKKQKLLKEEVSINGKPVNVDSLTVDYNMGPGNRTSWDEKYFFSGKYEDGEEIDDNDLDNLGSDNDELLRSINKKPMEEEATIRKGGKEYYVTYDPDTGEEQLEPTTAHIVKQEATATKDIYIDDIAGGVTISDPEEIDAYNRGETAYGTDRDGKDHEVQKQ